MCSSTRKIQCLLFLLSITLYTNADQLCAETKNCQCLNNNNHYEYQCSNEKILLHIYPSSTIHITCTNVTTLKTIELPKVEFRNVNKLKMNFCPLPENGIKEIADHLGLAKLNTLIFEYGVFDNLTLSSEKFKGIQNVTTLQLRANDLTAFEDTFFENFPELITLELDRNHLKLENNIFSPLTKLKFLSLSSNKLNEIPRDLFKNLNSLEKLYLWNNNLRYLDKHIFDGLQNLNVLDLMRNKIEIIEQGVFEATPNLVNVSLKYNSLKNISRRTFLLNDLLEQIVLTGNPDLVLDDFTFSNFQHLKIVEIDGAKIELLPNHLFKNSTSLIQLSLNRCGIGGIPEDTFIDLVNLRRLSLANNYIKIINDTTFSSLKNLEYLNLENNELGEINEELLKPLIKLKELNLHSNKIEEIHLNAFARNKLLRKIFLGHNLYRYKYKSFYPISPFNKCGDLEEIDLSYNEIMDFPEDLITLVSIKSINISHNNIRTLKVNSLWKATNNELDIDLESNKISYVNFDQVENMAHQQPDLDAYHNTRSPAVIRISRNPIVCDCFSYDLVRYIRNEMYPGVKTAIYFVFDDLSCDSPADFREISVEDLTAQMLSCPIEDVIENFNCTSDKMCGCFWRPFDSSLVIKCDGRNLTLAPKILHPRNLIFNQTEVNLENNLLERVPSADDVGNWNISRLFLRGNRIRSIDWIPPNLEVLDLRDNLMEDIDGTILNEMNSTSLERILLHGNPWKCECPAADLANYLKQHVYQVDTNDILCSGTNIPMINLNEKDLCPTNPMILILAAILIFSLCILSSFAAFYYKYQQEIKVWLYAHNLLLFLIEEEELDKDKIYDAFISYSHKDEDFVLENLISVLEGGPKPYKLCLHFRNWIPGEFIAKQVTTSVKDSKRTLVVLSPNFLESVWGKMEFRTAHTEAMREGRARVIIVLYGDIDMDSLDDELKAYMKTNTYIKWGDPWFWDKLKYALPHSKIKGLNSKSQKHANMMKYIDDKFGLVDDKTEGKMEREDSFSKESEKEVEVDSGYGEDVILKKEIV